MRTLPTNGLGEHHLDLREVARRVADEQVAPHAADVDERARFPRESLAALAAAGRHEVTLPEQYGRAGWPDHVAAVVVAEEIARVFRCTWSATTTPPTSTRPHQD